MVLITVVAAGILIFKRICWIRRQRQTAAQERLEEAEKAIQTVWDETIDHGTRLDTLESGNARLQKQSLAEENLQRVRSELHALRLMVQHLGRETSGPAMVVQTDVPGLRERIIREAQERGIGLSVRGESDEEGPEEPSDQVSD